MTPEIEAAIEERKAKLQKVKDEIDAAYWRFTRCARGQPPRRELYLARNELEREIRELKGKS